MDKVKTINSLMAHLRNHHGIKINGSSQKRQLRNIGYYHGYKGYRYIKNPENKINFSDFKHIVALNKFDMDLKSLFYPLIMFVETALKNYVLEVIICEGGSAHFQDIYGALITDYRKHKAGTSRYKKAYRRRLDLHNKIYSTLTQHYGLGQPVVQHFYHKDLSVPIWGIFELLTLGEFGLFISCLNEPVRKSISHELGLHQGCDSNGRLTENIVFAIRDLRNSVAHNDVIFDTRFKRGEVPDRLKSCLELETGVRNITFETIIDYLILLIYVSQKLKVTNTECKKHIRGFEEIIDTGRRQLPFPVFSQIVHTDTENKIKKLRNFCTG